MAQQGIAISRSDSGILEIAPGHKASAWSQITREATAITYVEQLIGWGSYADLYRVEYPYVGTRLYAVSED